MQRPQEAQQAHEGRNTIPEEQQQHLGAPRDIDGGGENSWTKGHDPYISPGDGSNEGMLGRNGGGDEPTLISKGRGTILGAAIPGHPTRARPHEGGYKRSSPSLYGCSGTENRIPVHGRGTTLPYLDKIQNAADRSFRRNRRPRRPPQHLQE